MIHLFLPCTLPRWSTGHLSSLHAFCIAVPVPLSSSPPPSAAACCCLRARVSMRVWNVHTHEMSLRLLLLCACGPVPPLSTSWTSRSSDRSACMPINGRCSAVASLRARAWHVTSQRPLYWYVATCPRTFVFSLFKGKKTTHWIKNTSRLRRFTRAWR